MARRLIKMSIFVPSIHYIILNERLNKMQNRLSQFGERCSLSLSSSSLVKHWNYTSNSTEIIFSVDLVIVLLQSDKSCILIRNAMHLTNSRCRVLQHPTNTRSIRIGKITPYAALKLSMTDFDVALVTPGNALCLFVLWMLQTSST